MNLIESEVEIMFFFLLNFQERTTHSRLGVQQVDSSRSSDMSVTFCFFTLWREFSTCFCKTSLLARISFNVNLKIRSYYINELNKAIVDSPFCEIRRLDVVDCFVTHDRVQSAYGVSNALQIVTRFGHSANAATRVVEVGR
jgi:hypothetical protein